MRTPRAVNVGLAAGAVGTVALTLAEKAEMAMSGRDPSDVPGQVGVRLSGREPAREPDLVKRLNPLVHWAHGIGLGAVRGGLDAAGLGRLRATVAFLPIVWAGDAALYRTLGLAPAPWRWSRGELAADVFGKSVLALATSGAYIVLDEGI